MGTIVPNSLPARIPVVQIAALLIALGAVALYWNGLPGGFLLDDFANLKTLDRFEGEFTGAKLGSFIFSNVSGDLGRLLPLLSFAVQHEAWPGDPGAFKALNIALHALNALLVFWLALRLAEVSRGTRDTAAAWTAALVSGMWALHPLLVSTVLYVIQRMAIMSAMFMFLGLIVYLAGRRRMAEGCGGVWLMAGGVVGGTALATACKENGALLPLVVLVVEFTLLADLPRGRGWWAWLAGTVVLPTAALVGYVAYHFRSWMLPGYALRDFGVTERLLTEARVLTDYLAQIVFPQPVALGLFHDDYLVSRSLTDPVSTLPAVALVVGLCLGAVLLRRRLPALSMGILWYFGAQILESGPIPLELYFEHRNYFPLAGLLIGAGIQIAAAVGNSAILQRYARYVVLAALGWVAMLGGITYAEVSLWADPYAQGGAWAKARPESIRAQANWAGLFSEMGFKEGSEDVYDSLTPRDPGYRLVAIANNCLRNGTRFREGYDEILARMRTMRFSRTVIGALEKLTNAVEAGRCLEDSGMFFEPTVAALLDNAHFASRRFHLLVLQGRYRIAVGRYAEARQDFIAAVSLKPDVEVAMLAVKASYLAGDRTQARKDLERAWAVNAHNGVARWTYAQDIEGWARAVQKMEPAGQTGEANERGRGGNSVDRVEGADRSERKPDRPAG